MQPTLEISQEGYIAVAVETFLMDRQAAGRAKKTLRFYRQYLKAFTVHCEAHAVRVISEITPDFLRRYLVELSATHNPGGVHGYYRALRAFLRWVEMEEILPPEWRNPIHKVKPPSVPEMQLEPVPLENVRALIASCQDPRDKAIFLLLLDTGMRASEVCSCNLEDVDMGAGSIAIPKSKSRKPRTVFIGRHTRRAMRAYLRTRRDRCPALFVTAFEDRLTYWSLRQILRRRSHNARIPEPSLHQFRRAFAINFLRNGGDIFTLQKLMGHADLAVLKRYLLLSDQDAQLAHNKFSPVDRLK